MKNLYLLFVLAVVFASCEMQKQDEHENDNSSTNIILLIGDGMGVSQLSAGIYYHQGKSSFEEFSNLALLNTSSLTHKVTDSGAGATAFATGKRTKNGMISMLPDSTYLEPITALLARNGYANALVATSSITHATPAAFYSNSLSRYDYEGIATQLHSSYIDFVAAGGYQYFVQRTDGVNYFDSLSYHHFTIDTNSLAQTLQADHKYAFLLAKGDLEASGAGRGDFLPSATNKALEYLGMKDQPFFLMVESSQVDLHL
jgi:alkaline phosphatase